MKLLPRKAVALLAFTMTCFVASCSASDLPSSEDEKQSLHFSGPYAEELETAYYESPSSFFRSVISDGVVTDAEFAEAQSRSKMCVEGLGFTDVQYFPEGGGSALPPPDLPEEEVHQKKAQCESEEGLVDTEAWYFTLLLNPDNLDWDESIKDCLVSAHILDAGSSVADMKQKMTLGDKRLESTAAKTCFTDPLGKLTKR